MDAFQRKIVFLNAENENDVLKFLQGKNALPSSEMFYFTDVIDGILIKQGWFKWV